MAAAQKVALVTGAGGGIGRAVVAKLLQDGFAVGAVDLALADLPCAIPASFAAWSADVTDERRVAAVVAECRKRFGRLDTVVHLTGAVGQGPLVEVSLDEWRRLLDVNLTSAFLIARATHEALKASTGSLLLTASVNARNGGSALSGPAYAVAKAGIVNLTRYLAKEWGGDGIRVNCIAPGPVDTPMVARLSAETIEGLRQSVPLGRIARPGDVASVVSFLCSPAASYLTGTTLNVSGGLLLD
jgi:3-oxoacyl-[acyl-carrier protein] reductase